MFRSTGPVFEDPFFVAFWVDEGPPPETDQEASADVFGGPEVADGSACDENEGTHGVEEDGEEDEDGDSCEFEETVEDADPRVCGLGETCG